MKEIRIKQFDINEVDEITLLTVEQAKEIPNYILACGDWWWLRSSNCCQYDAAVVYDGGDVKDGGDRVFDDYSTVRPVFRINNLDSFLGDCVYINKTRCTVIDKNLALADYPICEHRFDLESNDWKTSELKKFINSKEFISLL